MTLLVLASSSPYRRQLLNQLGLNYQTASPDIDETPLPDETPEALVRRLSEAKARALSATYPQALIIGSDQVASLDGRAIGKPGNHSHALQQLTAFQGRDITFFTGLCLLNSASGRTQLDVDVYRVRFRRLSSRQLDHYLKTEKPYDCAGSFKCEGLGVSLFETMEGRDPSSLVGLPLLALTRFLAEEGLDPLTP